MPDKDLKLRTKNFAHRCVRLCEALPKTFIAQHLAHQLVRCATSVAANYRSACLAQSKASFISKVSIVVEEVDEACFWMEFAIDEKIVKSSLVDALLSEGKELTAILLASRKTARANRK